MPSAQSLPLQARRPRPAAPAASSHRRCLRVEFEAVTPRAALRSRSGCHRTPVYRRQPAACLSSTACRLSAVRRLRQRVVRTGHRQVCRATRRGRHRAPASVVHIQCRCRPAAADAQCLFAVRLLHRELLRRQNSNLFLATDNNGLKMDLRRYFELEPDIAVAGSTAYRHVRTGAEANLL